MLKHAFRLKVEVCYPPLSHCVSVQAYLIVRTDQFDEYRSREPEQTKSAVVNMEAYYRALPLIRQTTHRVFLTSRQYLSDKITFGNTKSGLCVILKI